MEKRRVEYYEWQKNKENGYSEKVSMGDALFHSWGVDYEEFETGPGNYSVAIIEIENTGEVKSVPVHMIKFLRNN